MAELLPPALIGLTTYVLSLSGKAARAASVDALGDVDLRLGDMAALALLDHEGALAQRAIAERLRLHPSDVVRLLDALEGAGLVTRAADPADRRRHLVSITATGRRHLRTASEACERAADALLAPLDRAERAALHDLLTRVLASVDARVPAPDERTADAGHRQPR